MKTKLHPAWIVAGITFGTLFATAGFRSAPSVLILPLEEEFGWRRDVISAAIAINVLLYGLTAPFAAALMDRFTVRKVVMGALTVIGVGALLTIWMSQSWHLMLLWGVVVGVGTGSMALVFAATIANRWFVKNQLQIQKKILKIMEQLYSDVSATIEMYILQQLLKDQDQLDRMLMYQLKTEKEL